MTCPAAHQRCTLTIISRSLRICGILLLAGASYAPQSAEAQAVSASKTDSCANFGNAFDDGKDVHAVINYQSALRQLISREDFKQLATCDLARRCLVHPGCSLIANDRLRRLAQRPLPTHLVNQTIPFASFDSSFEASPPCVPSRLPLPSMPIGTRLLCLV